GNLILNGDFSQGNAHWSVRSGAGSVEFRDGYCFAKDGAVVEQKLELAPGNYRFSFESLFLVATTSFVNLSLEMSGLRKMFDLAAGPDYIPYTFAFSVPAPQDGANDLFLVQLIGDGAGGRFRNVQLVLVNAGTR
ncbi:MAG: hypothetical protein ABIO21_26475, partial [Pseudomonas sp.]